MVIGIYDQIGKSLLLYQNHHFHVVHCQQLLLWTGLLAGVDGMLIA
jgi:hypothetical protein